MLSEHKQQSQDNDYPSDDQQYLSKSFHFYFFKGDPRAGRAAFKGVTNLMPDVLPDSLLPLPGGNKKRGSRQSPLKRPISGIDCK
jgi:hypothetical protein